MKGRKPKDLALKLLQGNPGHRPLDGGGALFTVAPLEKPTHLDEHASREWDRLITTLAPILSPASAGMVLIAADAYSQMMTTNAVLRSKGLTYKTVSESGSVMIRQRPEVRMKESARRAYHQALAELGASPVAHTRVRRLSPEKLEPSGVKKLLG